MLRANGRISGGGASSTVIRRLAGGNRCGALGGGRGSGIRHRRWIHHRNNSRRLCAHPIVAPCGISTPSCYDNDRHYFPISHQHLLFFAPRRSFALNRRPLHHREVYKSPDPDLFDDGGVSPSDLKTADDMEDYDFLTEEYYNPHEDEDDDDGQHELDEEEMIRSDLEAERRAQEIRDELDQRTGRLWTDPWEITEQDWFEGKQYDDLPDWSPELCSRVSLERVKVLEGGIPTISTLSTLALPPPSPPRPSSSEPQPYLKQSRRRIRSAIAAAVEAEAAPEIQRILSLPTWEEKQDAVDELFESVEETLRSKKGGGGMMEVLSAQPNFGDLVEGALERYLRQVVRKEVATTPPESSAVEGEEKEGDTAAYNDDLTDGASPAESDATSGKGPTAEDDEAAVPVFMDLIGGADGSDDDKGGGVNDTGVPNIVHPLQSHPKEGVGRMVEEWDLAANKKTKRIMVRRCVRDIARALEEADQEGEEGIARRIYVKGRKGAGKTAAIAAAVASARTSGRIVLYLPDGDRLRKLGFYIKPNLHRVGKLFDLPVLAKEVCGQLLQSHGKDLDDIVAPVDRVRTFLTEDEIKKVTSKDGDDTAEGGDGDISIADLLRAGSDSTTLSSGCYGAVIDALMNQTSKSFVVVMDEFNCYFDHGYYFHEEYDPDVRRPIPCHKITLFKPLLEGVGLAKAEDRKGLPRTESAVPMKRGAILVGISESRAVARKFTDAITETMVEQEEQQAGVKVVDVPQFSPLEVEHVIANFEVTGIGRLRFDRGSTVMDDQEVAYLRMVSGGIGQNLLDACIV